MSVNIAYPPSTLQKTFTAFASGLSPVGSFGTPALTNRTSIFSLRFHSERTRRIGDWTGATGTEAGVSPDGLLPAPQRCNIPQFDSAIQT
jgi:hypothetical protein